MFGSACFTSRYVWVAVGLFGLCGDSAVANDDCPTSSVEAIYGDLNGLQQGMVENALRQQLNGLLNAAEAAEEEDEDGGWVPFVREVIDKLTFDGILDRFLEVERIIEAVEAGASPAALGIDPEDYRLRNVAEMTDVLREIRGAVERPTADSLKAANQWFYVLFGNRGGDFSGMDMAEYREIARMPGDQGAERLPHFEERLFANSNDPDTRRFGNSLPAEQRLDLFLLHNRVFAPEKSEGAP